MSPAPRAAIAFATALQGAGAEIAVLYDPDRVPGTTETLVDQGFEKVSSDIFNQEGFYAAGDGATDFDSGPGDEQVATFFTHGLITGDQFHPEAQTLDRSLGFRLSIELAIDLEANQATDLNSDGVIDSAGFSMAVVASDLFGVGIQFWGDRVWATKPVEDQDSGETLLVQAEGVEQLADAIASLRRYDIEVKGEVYRIKADGMTILTGPLRDYTNFAGVPTPFGTLNNFDKPNSITLGDANRVSHSQTRIGDITSETPYQPTPEPGELSISETPEGVSVSWPSAPCLHYSVRASETMEFFEEIADPIATGFQAEHIDTRPRVGKRFYKIVPIEAQ